MGRRPVSPDTEAEVLSGYIVRWMTTCSLVSVMRRLKALSPSNYMQLRCAIAEVEGVLTDGR